MLYEHYLDLVDDVAALVAELGAHADERVSDRAATLLQRLDLLHREGLVRLVRGLRAHGAADALDRATEDDPVVRILLGLYGLAELPMPASPDDDAHDGASGFFPIERLAVRRARSGAAAEDAAE